MRADFFVDIQFAVIYRALTEKLLAGSVRAITFDSLIKKK